MIARKAETVSDRVPMTAETARSRPRVLVIDDDAMRELVGELLTREGYAVATVRHGAAALELLRHIRPDVIALDLRLPQMDAGPFLERYRQDAASPPPIILLSAALDLRQHAARLGACAYVEKPFDLEELKEAIASCVVPV